MLALDILFPLITWGVFGVSFSRVRACKDKPLDPRVWPLMVLLYGCGLVALAGSLHDRFGFSIYLVSLIGAGVGVACLILRAVVLHWKWRHLPLHPSAVTAARWWGDHFRVGQNRFNGADDSPTGGMIAFMAADAHAPVDRDDPRVGRFEWELAREISQQLYYLERHRRRYGGTSTPTVYLRCDYGPMEYLGRAIVAANLERASGCLPTKTSMHVTATSVGVSGYCEPWTDVPIETKTS